MQKNYKKEKQRQISLNRRKTTGAKLRFRTSVPGTSRSSTMSLRARRHN